MWDQGSEIKGLGWAGITALGSGISSPGIGINSFFFLRDQESGCTIFVGSGTSFGIKDKKFGYKNGISNEKNIRLIMTLPLCCL